MARGDPGFQPPDLHLQRGRKKLLSRYGLQPLRAPLLGNVLVQPARYNERVARALQLLHRVVVVLVNPLTEAEQYKAGAHHEQQPPHRERRFK